MCTHARIPKPPHPYRETTLDLLRSSPLAGQQPSIFGHNQLQPVLASVHTAGEGIHNSTPEKETATKTPCSIRQINGLTHSRSRGPQICHATWFPFRMIEMKAPSPLSSVLPTTQPSSNGLSPANKSKSEMTHHPQNPISFLPTKVPRINKGNTTPSSGQIPTTQTISQALLRNFSSSPLTIKLAN